MPSWNSRLLALASPDRICSAPTTFRSISAPGQKAVGYLCAG